MTKQSIWSIISNYRFKSIFIRNFFLILLLIVTPLIIINYIVYYKLSDMSKQDIYSQNYSSINRIGHNMDTIYKDTKRLATQLSLQDDVELFMLTNYFSEKGTEETRNQLNMYSNTFQYIDSIYLYSELKQSVLTNRYVGSASLLKDQTWYEYYENINENKTFVQPREYKDWYPYFLSVYYPIYIDNNKMGAIIINLNIRDLRTVIESNNGGFFEDLYIVDNSDNSILYNADMSHYQKNIFSLFEDVPSYSKEEFTSQSVNIHGDEYLMSRNNIEDLDWSVISLLSLKHFEETNESIRTFIYLSIIGSLFIAVIISFFISIRTYKPVGDVITFLKEPEKSIDLKEKVVKNELLYIYNQIKKSYKSKASLEKELDERLQLLNKAQMVALQAQISPHFLSNTLETMKWNAMRLTGGENEVSKMTVSLARLLRFTLGAEKSIISIDEEIELDKKYIELMEFRFRNVFQTEWDVDDSLLEYETIQLTLQPIIENAIFHGIKPQKELGTISVQVKEEKSDILFIVADNGQGIDQETVRTLNRQMQEEYNLEGKYVGVRNVNQRIKLIFGDKYGVYVWSEQNIGTKVTARIPKYKFNNDQGLV